MSTLRQLTVEMAYRLLRWTLVPLFIREVVQRRKVTILLYHDIKPEVAKKHFQFLTSKYNIIPLRRYLEARESKTFRNLPPKSLVLTLDDGVRSNYGLLPLLKSLKIPVTIFLCSSIVGTNRLYWDREARNRKRSLSELKTLPLADRNKELSKLGFTLQKEYDERAALAAAEIDEMKPYVDFQSHTRFHTFLPSCSDGEALEEISGSKRELEEKFGLDVYAFSYPNGDYSERDVALVQRAGYTCGVTCDLWFNSETTDVFRLKRLGCRDTASISELAVKVTGLYHFMSRLLFGRSFGHYETRFGGENGTFLRGSSTLT